MAASSRGPAGELVDARGIKRVMEVDEDGHKCPRLGELLTEPTRTEETSTSSMEPGGSPRPKMEPGRVEILESKTHTTVHKDDHSSSVSSAKSNAMCRDGANRADVLSSIRSAIDRNDTEALSQLVCKESVCRKDIVPMFFRAFEQGKSKCVEILIKAGYSPSLNLELVPESGLLPVLSAMDRQDPYVLRALLCCPEEVQALENLPAIRNPTILFTFILYNNLEMVEVLLQAGFNPNLGNAFPKVTSKDYPTVIPDIEVASEDVQAIFEEEKEMERLRRHTRGYNAARRRKYCQGKFVPAMYPLIEACRSSTGTAMAKLLLKYNADPSLADSFIKETPILAAVQAGCVETAKLLLDAGADIDMADLMHRTPVYQAVIHDNIDMVKMLLTAGANPNGRISPVPMSCRDITNVPLLACVEHPPKLEIAKLLLAADEICINNEKLKQSVLDRAVTRSQSVEMVRLLLEAGANHSSALHAIAGCSGPCDEDIVDLLVTYGADVDLPVCGVTPLMQATNRKRSDIVYILLQHNCKLQRPRRKGRAFNTAFSIGAGRIMVMLEAAGANASVFRRGYDEDKLPKRLRLSDETNYIAYLKERWDIPLTLKEQARLVIRRKFTKKPFKQSVLKMTNLPNVLKDYLLLKDMAPFVKEEEPIDLARERNYDRDHQIESYYDWDNDYEQYDSSEEYCGIEVSTGYTFEELNEERSPRHPPFPSSYSYSDDYNSTGGW